MKKFVALLAAAAALYAVPASAQVYIEGNVGASFANDSNVSVDAGALGSISGDIGYDTAAVFGGAVGYRFSPNFRAEANLSYRNPDVEDDSSEDVGVLAGMLNGYYDITTGTAFRPYVGAGIGFADVSVDTGDGTVDDSDTVFAWNLLAGVAYALNSNIDLTLGYRFLKTADASFDTAIAGVNLEADYETHEVMIGVRYTF